MNPTAEDMTYTEAQAHHRLLFPTCRASINDLGTKPLDRTYELHDYSCPQCPWAVGKIRRRTRVGRRAA